MHALMAVAWTLHWHHLWAVVVAMAISRCPISRQPSSASRSTLLQAKFACCLNGGTLVAMALLQAPAVKTFCPEAFSVNEWLSEC